MNSAELSMMGAATELMYALHACKLPIVRRILTAHPLPALLEVVPLPPLLHVLFSSAPNSDENAAADAAANLVSDPSSVEMRRRIAVARVLIHEFGVDPKAKIAVSPLGKVIRQRGMKNLVCSTADEGSDFLLFSLLHFSCMGLGRESRLDVKGYGCPLELIPFLVGECGLDVEEEVVEVGAVVDARRKKERDEVKTQAGTDSIDAEDHREYTLMFLPYIERTPLELLVSDNFRHQSATSSRDRRRAAAMLLRDCGANAHRHNDHLPDALRLGYRRVIWDTTVSAISHWNLARRFVDDKSPNADVGELIATSWSGATGGEADNVDCPADENSQSLDLLELLMSNRGYASRHPEASPSISLSTPCCSAAEAKRFPLASFESAMSENGCRFLHHVVRMRRLEVAKLLIDRYGANPMLRDCNGETILHLLPTLGMKMRRWSEARSFQQRGSEREGRRGRKRRRETDEAAFRHFEEDTGIQYLTSTAEEEEEGEEDPDQWEDFAAFVLERVDDVNAFACDATIPPIPPSATRYFKNRIHCYCQNCEAPAIRCHSLPLIHAALDFESQRVLTRLLLEKYRVNTAIIARKHFMQIPLHVFCVLALRRYYGFTSHTRWAEETARTIRLLVANYCPTEDEPTLTADGGIDAQDEGDCTPLHLVIVGHEYNPTPAPARAFLIGLLIREFGASTSIKDWVGATALDRLLPTVSHRITSASVVGMLEAFIHIGGAAIGPYETDDAQDIDEDDYYDRRFFSAFATVEARMDEFADDDERKRFIVCAECAKMMTPCEE